MRNYATRTVPMLRQHVLAGIADPSRLDEAAVELGLGAADARRLARLYRTLGRTREAAEAETSGDALEGEAAALRDR